MNALKAISSDTDYKCASRPFCCFDSGSRRPPQATIDEAEKTVEDLQITCRWNYLKWHKLEIYTGGLWNVA
jgi:hypothetical protein